MRNLKFLMAVMLLVTASLSGDVLAQSTYQGQLNDGGSPYNGLVDLTFQLYDDETGGATVGALQEVDNVTVTDGLFQAEFNLPGATSSAYEDTLWLEVSVDGNILSPRQKVTAAPLARRAEHATSAQSAVNFSIGPATSASGAGSLAMGGLSGAGGVGSFAGGALAIANHNYSFVWNGLGDGTFSATDDNQFLIRAPGGVGINTNSPAATLDINSQIGPGTSAIRVAAEGYSSISIGGSSTGLFIDKTSTGSGAAIRGSCGSSSGTCRALLGHSTSGTGYGLFTSGNPGSTNYMQRRLDLGEALWYTSQPDTGTWADACWGSDGSDYRLARCSSSATLKHDIEDIDVGLDLVHSLRPVSFAWNGSNQLDLGLIAEEVAALEPRLATYNDDGSPASVNYRHLTAVLIKAIQQDHAHTQTALTTLGDEIHQRDVEIAALRAELNEVRVLAASAADTAQRLAALEAILMAGVEVAAAE